MLAAVLGQPGWDSMATRKTPSGHRTEKKSIHLKLKRMLSNPDVPLQEALAGQASLVDEGLLARVMDEALMALIDTKAYDRACELLALRLAQPDFLEGKLHQLGHLAHAVVQANRPDLKARFIARLSGHGEARWNSDCDSSNYSNNIGAYAVQVMHDEAWTTAIELFDLALSIEAPRPPRERLELYANALYPLQHDNSKLPVDAGLNRRFLARTLPFGPHNPGIYFNAACLYVEMNEFDEAVKMVKLAVRNGYDGLAEMKSQIDTLPMFKQFRKYPAYQALRFHPGH